MNTKKTIVKWQAPSNIALIKYWGKKGDQLPLNPSLSFTLKKSHTITSVAMVANASSESGVASFNFQNHPTLNDSFGKKIDLFVKKYFKLGFLEIESFNSFPHSTGIASSASSFAALSLALTDLSLNGSMDEEFYQKASHFARLGSGSASRSLFGPLVCWGEHPAIKGSNDSFAVKIDDSLIHPKFSEFKDAILVVDSKEKQLSSTNGHSTFNQHPYKEARVKQAQDHFNLLLTAMQSGDMQRFFAVVEQEAMALHGLIMTSAGNPILMHPNTVLLIKKIQSLRQKSGLSFGFTLDAGPNIHLLYGKADEFKLYELIENELKPYCENGQVIYDEVGLGPTKLL